MSEKLPSHDPVVQALDLEKKIAQKLAQPSDAARKEVRASMEEWMQLMDKPKIRKQYKEELGEVDPNRAEAEMLTAINRAFPKIAKDLGYTKEMEQQLEAQQNEMAA